MSVDEIIKELQNRKAHMQLLREEEEKAAESSRSSNSVQRGGHRAGAGVPRTLYAKNDFCRTKFLVKGDPYVVFGRISAILIKKLKTETVPSKKGKFKIRFSKAENLPEEEQLTEETSKVPESELFQREVAFTVKIMAANEADLGKAVEIKEEEDQESKDLFVGFHRDAISDYDMFMDCYQHVKNEMLSSTAE